VRVFVLAPAVAHESAAVSMGCFSFLLLPGVFVMEETILLAGLGRSIARGSLIAGMVAARGLMVRLKKLLGLHKSSGEIHSQEQCDLKLAKVSDLISLWKAAAHGKPGQVSHSLLAVGRENLPQMDADQRRFGSTLPDFIGHRPPP